MKKIILYTILISMMMTGCFGGKTDSEAGKVPNQALTELLPSEGFRWTYQGFVDYGHQMDLVAITKDNNRILYKVTGEVEDLSSGESSKDYTIEMYYIIEGDSLTQKKAETMMMDSDFDELTLIKAPLEKGTTWTEDIEDKTGKKRTIKGTIMEVVDADDTIYKVSYEEPKTDYFETREIAKNYGVISFTRSMIFDGDSYSIGYGLYGDGSGYFVDDTKKASNETKITEDKEDQEEPNDVDTKEEEETKTDTSGEKTQILDEEVSAAIYDFNSAWIDYVNEGNEDFFTYVVKGSSAYNNGKNFDRTGLKEKFLKIEIKDISISLDKKTAVLTVFEKIQKTKDGSVKVVEYTWDYSLVNSNGKWLIKSYKLAK